MAADRPVLCVATSGQPCPELNRLDDGTPPCQADSPLHWRCEGCNGCNGDGTRTVHTPAPDGSVLLTPSDREELRLRLARLLWCEVGGWSHEGVPSLILDALGLDRG